MDRANVSDSSLSFLLVSLDQITSSESPGCVIVYQDEIFIKKSRTSLQRSTAEVLLLLFFFELIG